MKRPIGWLDSNHSVTWILLSTIRRTAIAITCLLVLMVFAVTSTSWSQESAETKRIGPATQGEGLIRNEPGAYQGYTLLSPLQSKITYLMNMEGKVVHSWKTDYVPASLGYLLPNGNLFRAGSQPNVPWGPGPAAGGRVQEIGWDGELVWDFTYFNDKMLPHHDFKRLPNGNVLLITKNKKTSEECIGAGAVPASVQGVDLQVDGLVEIKPTGKTTGDVVWEWHLWDHLVQDFAADKANYGEVAAHPELVDFNYDRGVLLSSSENRGGNRKRNADWTHANAVAYNEALDQIVISIHEFSEIWIIDHSTTTAEAASHKGGRIGKGGDLLYRWGNPIVYRAGTKEDQRLFAQHDVHWIAKGLKGEGHLMLFNNGVNRPGGNHSTVDEIETPVDANGRYALTPTGRFGPDQPVWSYAAPNPPDFFSNFISGASRLPNGNTLICSGANGILFEVTQDKQVVWNYMNPARNDRGGGRGGPPPGGPPPGFPPPGGPQGFGPPPGGFPPGPPPGSPPGPPPGAQAFGPPPGAPPPGGPPPGGPPPGGPGRGGRGGGGGGPNGKSIFRVYRYGLDYPGLAGKQLTPGKSLEEIVRETTNPVTSPTNTN